MLPPGLETVLRQLEQSPLPEFTPVTRTILDELRFLNQDLGFQELLKRMSPTAPAPGGAPNRCSVCGCDRTTCT
jgi:hypothetical protein